MNLSDLLHCRVLDADGVDVGPVDDVRLVQDGPLLLSFGAAFRIDGFVVGHSGIGRRLGYVRGGVKGPWLLRVIFHAIERRTRFVRWDDVETWDGHVVRITKRADELAPVD
jgi:hypothetical protein